MTEKVEKKQGFASKAKKYLTECKVELKKVTWPSKKQLIRNSIVIIVFIAIVTVILSVLDLGFGKLFELMTELL